MQKRVYILLLLLFMGVIPAKSQSKFLSKMLSVSYPSINELESQYGSFEFSEEFLVALETAQMEQALQEEDSVGFSEGFSDEGGQGIKTQPVQTIIEFMGYFIRIMRSRVIHSSTNEEIPGTFDFTIRDLTLQPFGNKIHVTATVEFSYLTENDSSDIPISYGIQATFHKQQKRWKIEHVQGLFEFFYACIERVAPSRKIPRKYRRLVTPFRSQKGNFIRERDRR